MHKYILSKIILSFILLFFSVFSHANNNYSTLYIFGDSLSDTGNFASVAGEIPAPYYNNRISNGPVAVETLAENLGLSADASLHLLGFNEGTNYAVATANAVSDGSFDLEYQIVAFQAIHANIAPADALYVVFIGGNDIRDAIRITDFNAAKLSIQAAVDAVISAVDTLIMSGARSFLVISSPDIAKIPETRILAEETNNPNFIFSYAHRLSKYYQKRLKKKLKRLKKDYKKDNYNVEIKAFNLFKFFNKMIRQADQLGFTYVTEPCFYRSTFSFNPNCNNGANADEFLFFDEIHPTTRAHTIIGEGAYRTLMHH